MIAPWLALGALAAPAEVDVMFSAAGVGTPALVTRDETTDVWGQTQQAAVPLDRLPFQPALAVEWFGGPPGDTEWMLGLSGAWERRTWEFPGSDLRASVAELRATVGLRAFFEPGWDDDEPRADGYGVVAAGVQGAWLSAEPFASALAPSMVGQFGLGAGSRRGPVRVRAEVRADLVFRVDHLDVHAERPDGAVAFSWWPGSAGIGVWVGGGFDARRAGRTRAAPATPDPGP